MGRPSPEGVSEAVDGHIRSLHPLHQRPHASVREGLTLAVAGKDERAPVG